MSISTADESPLLALPKLVIEIILHDFVVTQYTDVLPLATVCKRFNQLLLHDDSSNALWQRLTLQQWPHTKMRANVKFVTVFRKRVEALGGKLCAENAVIENCPTGFEWEFKCPVALAKIQRTPLANVDHCEVCDEHVYLCSTIEELAGHVEKQHCVAFDADGEIKSKRRMRQRPMMGMMVMRR